MKSKIIYIFWLIFFGMNFAIATQDIVINSKIDNSTNIISVKFIDIKGTNLENARQQLPTDDTFINSQKQSLYNYISIYRNKNKLNSLTINTKLEISAQKFAQYLSDIWRLIHYGYNWELASDRFIKEWLKNSFWWEIISSSINLSWAVASWADSPLHWQIFNSTWYDSIWIWYQKWMRVVVYYLDKDINKHNPPKSNNNIVKTCIVRKYKYIKNIKKKLLCLKYK